MKEVPVSFHEGIPKGFRWHNEPGSYSLNQALTIHTQPKTDFWQNTHYGFRSDNGHSLLKTVEGDFALSAHFEFAPKVQYDQCGLLVRGDAHNWIKVSTEYENEKISRLGSVVTNFAYSDWATNDVSSKVGAMHYRISKRGADFLIEHSHDGSDWLQMRIAHLHHISSHLDIGVYACSPKDSSFVCKVTQLYIRNNQWFPD
ncbi:MAG: DUF1349 domain-containing protein [Bacteroidota bacterium]